MSDKRAKKERKKEQKRIEKSRFLSPEPYRLYVCVGDATGKLCRFPEPQRYEDFMSGSRDWRLVLPVYGDSLAHILFEEGYIHYDENSDRFCDIVIKDGLLTPDKLIGKIAETVIVRKCNASLEVNKDWLRVGRRGVNRMTAPAEHAIAVATGSKITLRNYPHYFDPSNTQADIVWINENQEYIMAVHPGQIAELQIKVSMNGMAYVLPDLLTGRYRCPVVYFPLNNDYEKVYKALVDARSEKKDGRNADSSTLWWFENVQSLEGGQEIFDEVLSFRSLLEAMAKGELAADWLMQSAREHPVLKDAILSSVLDGARIDARDRGSDEPRSAAIETSIIVPS